MNRARPIASYLRRLAAREAVIIGLWAIASVISVVAGNDRVAIPILLIISPLSVYLLLAGLKPHSPGDAPPLDTSQLLDILPEITQPPENWAGSHIPTSRTIH